MIVKKNKSTTLLAGCIAVSIVALSGCRSGGFNKPNFDALKFWKSPDSIASSKTPPPPARYFDPAPILEEQVAETNVGKTIELNGQRFNEQLNQTVANNASSFSNSVNSNVRSLNELIPKAPTSDSLSNAQQDFKTAMQDTVNRGSSLKKAVEPPSKWNDFELPADIEVPKIKQPLNQSLAGLNKSIYDADGRLVNSKQEARESIFNKLDQTRNSFPVETKVSGASTNQFIAAIKDRAGAVTPLKPKQFDFKAPDLPVSAPIAKAVSSPLKLPSFMASTTTRPAASSDKELKLIKAQVADANRQIEQLKQQIAMAIKQPQSQAPVQTPAAIPDNTLPKPPVAVAQHSLAARTAQLKTPRFGTSSYSAANYPKSANSFVGVSTTNILRATSPQTTPAQPATTEATPAFPSTPHGNFAPQGNFGATYAPGSITPPNRPNLTPQPAAAVNFQTGGDDSMTLKASTPNFAKPAGTRKIKSHISNVDIPASILNGSGSYAPGSVHQVGQ